MPILDLDKLSNAKTPKEFMKIILDTPEGLIFGKKLKKDGIEIKYEYSEKMKDLFEFHGINIDDEYKAIFEGLGNDD